MLGKFVDLNFKTADGITRFFKYGIFSKGIPVSDLQQAELKATLRSVYVWWGLFFIITGFLIGPFLPALFLPALFVWYAIRVGVIVNVSAPDRISMTENFQRLSLILPRWLGWFQIAVSGPIVALGCAMFVIEAFAVKRAERSVADYGGSLSVVVLMIVFFSLCMVAGMLMVALRRRMDPSGKPQTVSP